MFDVLMGAGWLCLLLFLVSLFTRRTAFFFQEKTKKKALLTWGMLVFVFFGTVGVFYSDELNAVGEAEEKRAAEVEKATLEAHKQAEAEARKKPRLKRRPRSRRQRRKRRLRLRPRSRRRKPRSSRRKRRRHRFRPKKSLRP